MRATLLSYKGGSFKDKETGENIPWSKVTVASSNIVSEDNPFRYHFGYYVEEISIPRYGFLTSYETLKNLVGSDVDLVYDQILGRKHPVLVDIRPLND